MTDQNPPVRIEPGETHWQRPCSCQRRHRSERTYFQCAYSRTFDEINGDGPYGLQTTETYLGNMGRNRRHRIVELYPTRKARDARLRHVSTHHHPRVIKRLTVCKRDAQGTGYR